MLSIYQGQLSPSVTDTISVNGTPFNLTDCTVTFNMRAADSSTLAVSAAATIVNTAAGTVRYDWNSGDTDATGYYVFWWTVALANGDDQDTPETDLQIAAHAVPAANALCTVTDVHVAMEIPQTDTTLDPIITEYINEASAAIIKATRREFAPVTTSSARTFRVSNRGRIDFTAFGMDLQSATQVMLHPEEAMYVVGATDYELRPLNNPEGVYSSLTISPWIPLVSLRQLKFGHAWCEITGTWGWPSVPEPVKRAAVVTVRTWLRRDAQKMAGSIGGQYYTGQELTPDTYTTYALPAAARKLLLPYRRDFGAI
ncbi:MAG: hypothetical protein ACRD3Q_12440 [Terriglobales bacterium]